MTISGFTFLRNASKLYYPVKESILSILPIVDEFVIALGDGDPDDNTLEMIQSIHSEKIRIIHTKWDLAGFPNGTEYARQTDIAKQHCKGDWLFYLQGDEVIHEDDLSEIQKRCSLLLNKPQVEGLLFDYLHFWGDYNHVLLSHAWYRNEIRIIRNDADIHSWRDAQSFRRIPNFDGKNYRQKNNSFKLKVASANARVFHYGWVRPPSYMRKKSQHHTYNYTGRPDTQLQIRKEKKEQFNYGDLSNIPLFKASHPAVMKGMINRFNWQEELILPPSAYMKHKHEKLKNRLLSAVENNLLNGKQIFTFKNYTTAGIKDF